jgi:mRNA-degrading endonuclease toxin of MazEF toxin-antitoxin module
VDFDPAVGSEPAKNRPAAVVSGEDLAHLPTRIVVPLTTWRPRHAGQWNKILVRRDESNDLDVDSAADVALIRVVDLQRFGERMGVLATDVVDEIVAGVLVAVGHRPGA